MRRGFTLIELLVVIAIIAILIALLQPVFLLGVEIAPCVVRVDDQIPAITVKRQASVDLDQLWGRRGLRRPGLRGLGPSRPRFRLSWASPPFGRSDLSRDVLESSPTGRADLNELSGGGWRNSASATPSLRSGNRFLPSTRWVTMYLAVPRILVFCA
jgi:prepilin-type N-terminal cleavage/methylation domain-containing protein